MSETPGRRWAFAVVFVALATVSVWGPVRTYRECGGDLMALVPSVFGRVPYGKDPAIYPMALSIVLVVLFWWGAWRAVLIAVLGRPRLRARPGDSPTPPGGSADDPGVVAEGGAAQSQPIVPGGLFAPDRRVAPILAAVVGLAAFTMLGVAVFVAVLVHVGGHLGRRIDVAGGTYRQTYEPAWLVLIPVLIGTTLSAWLTIGSARLARWRWQRRRSVGGRGVVDHLPPPT